MPRQIHRPLPLVAVLFLAALSVGCDFVRGAPANPFDAAPPVAADADAEAEAAPPAPSVTAWTGDVRSLRAFDGRTGRRLAWSEVISRARAADAIILGEQHNDAVAHAAQAVITGDVLSARPNGAVALEMLERDEQRLVDDWLDDIIDAEQLATLSRSTDWAGDGSWAAWYQPVLDAARSAGATVVAANAPRRYVRLARTGGFPRLAALPDDRRALVTWPDTLDTSDYRRRFAAFMSGEFIEGPMPPATADDPPEASNVEPIFRSQQTWDATMADSVARTLQAGTSPVLLLIGQFHSDFNGGTVLELQRRQPDASILNISFQPRGEDALADVDRGRADIVIDTGMNADADAG